MAKYAWTIGGLIKGEYDLSLTCTACRHRSDVDLLALSVARGENFTLQRLVDAAVCERCGAKAATPTIIPAETFRMGPGSH